MYKVYNNCKRFVTNTKYFIKGMGIGMRQEFSRQMQIYGLNIMIETISIRVNSIIKKH